MRNTKFRKQEYRKRSLWEWLFSNRVRERRCPTCGVPFLEHPEREPTRRFVTGDVELMLFSSNGIGGKRNTLRLGVWRKSRDGYYLSQLMDQRELKDLIDVAEQAVLFFAVKNKVVTSTVSTEMSSLTLLNKKTK